MEGELSMWTILPLWIKLLFGLVFAIMLLFLVGKAISPVRSVCAAKIRVATEASGTLFLATGPRCNTCSIAASAADSCVCWRRSGEASRAIEMCSCF